LQDSSRRKAFQVGSLLACVVTFPLAETVTGNTEAMTLIVNWLMKQDIESPCDLRGVNHDRLLDNTPESLSIAEMTFLSNIIQVCILKRFAPCFVGSHAGG
jgi:hypothetical protein